METHGLENLATHAKQTSLAAASIYKSLPIAAEFDREAANAEARRRKEHTRPSDDAISTTNGRNSEAQAELLQLLPHKCASK